jgi:uncharacterized membrane protein
MGHKIFALISGVIFLLIAILHVLRVAYAWDAVIGGWEVPKWISWVAIVVGVYLGYEGLRLSKSLH